MADGLWLWRQPHPDWQGQTDWEPAVSSFAVASGGARVLLDPLAPPPSAREAWERIEAFAADTVVVLKPDHVRDVDLFVRWYGARALGPLLFWRDDIPKTELEGVRTGDELPGGLVALDDGRGMLETPLYLPEQRALVFADGLTAPGDGELRVWASAQHHQRALPALRAHARAAVRARAGLPRRAGPYPSGLRGRAGARAVLRAGGRVTDEFGELQTSYLT